MEVTNDDIRFIAAYIITRNVICHTNNIIILCICELIIETIYIVQSCRLCIKCTIKVRNITFIVTLIIL